MADVYLALGANLGDRRQQLRRAVAALAQRGVRMRRVSSLYETEPMYQRNQPPFLNAVAEIQTDLTPEELLRAVKEVEHELGRRNRARFGPRELDVDILLYDDERRDSKELTIPHPRMAERPFVQVPLAELGGEVRTAAGVTLVDGPGWVEGQL